MRPPRIHFDSEGVPFSEEFSDVYFSREGGLSETELVFLSRNGLPERWQNASEFQIGELGFGTGLNFLVTLKKWLSSPHPPSATLRFWSCERFPLSLDQMESCHAAWPELASLSRDFLSQYAQSREKDSVIEYHSPEFQVSLTVFCGEALVGLQSSAPLCDAWYLDGFSPAKNPELWSLELLREVFQHTKRGGSFATYAAAGWVRRNLQAAGFHLERVKGFGRKREALRGERLS